MISTSDFEKGIILKIDTQPWMIVDFDFMNPGKGGAVYRTRLKNLKTGSVVERTFKSGETFEEIEQERKNAKYLYSDRRNSVFLVEENNQRVSVPIETAQEKVKYLKPNSELELIYLEGELISISIPIKVDLKVVEAEQAVRGNTATNVMKKVKVETGLELNAPMFIESGDTIRINTDTGQYIERANK